jgi:hypothetical protein
MRHHLQGINVVGKPMRTVFITILILCRAPLQAQTIQTKPISAHNKREFKNQGEQEDSLAVQFF